MILSPEEVLLIINALQEQVGHHQARARNYRELGFLETSAAINHHETEQKKTMDLLDRVYCNRNPHGGIG